MLITPRNVALLSGSQPYSNYALALDFKNGVYRSGSTLVRDVSQLPGYSYTRAGAKAEFDASNAQIPFAANVPGIVSGIGYWARQALTNFLLNAGSAANLSTQSVTVTAQAYTLSFIGTGTVTLTGTSTAGPLVGTGAGNRVSLTFTPTAGVVLFTVTGSVTFAGLVAGLQPGPIIATAGATATVAADNMQLSQPIPVDEDWAIWGTVNFDHAVTTTANEYLASVNDGTGNNRISLIRSATNGALSLLVQTGGVVQISVSSGVLQAGVGRGVVGVRHRAGKFTAFGKNAASSTSLGADTTGTYPTGMNRLDPGSLVAGQQANSPVEFIGYRRGTFSDADLSTILAAA